MPHAKRGANFFQEFRLVKGIRLWEVHLREKEGDVSYFPTRFSEASGNMRNGLAMKGEIISSNSLGVLAHFP